MVLHGIVIMRRKASKRHTPCGDQPLQQPLFLFPTGGYLESGGHCGCKATNLYGDIFDTAASEKEDKLLSVGLGWEGGGKLVVGPTRKLIGVEHIRPPSLEARGAIHY